MPTLTIGPRTTFFYDAEYHIGLVPWASDSATCIANANKLNLALEAMHYAGAFQFANGTVGPVLYPIVFSGKTFYVRPPIKTNTRIGGALLGSGTRSYEMLDYDFQGGTRGGMKTRIVGINAAAATEPVFRIRGSGFLLSGMDIFGRQKYNWTDAGDRAVACIQVEGAVGQTRGSMADAGRPTLRDLGLFESQYAIQSLGGYYTEGGAFVEDQNHSDIGFASNIECFNVESVFRSENQQAVGWLFEQIVLEVVGNTAPAESIVFDLQYGGCVNCRGLTINQGKVCVLQVSEWSNNNNNIEVTGIFRDRSSSTDVREYLTLVKWKKGTVADWAAPGIGWRVRMSGHFSDPDLKRYNFNRWMQCEYPDIDVSDMLFDFNNMPKTEFTQVSGPWYKWNSMIGATIAHYMIHEDSGTTIRDKYEIAPAGTITGATWVADRDGNATKALSFASTNNVSIPNDIWYNHSYTNTTVAFWVYLNSYTAGNILTKTTAGNKAGFRTETGPNRFYLTQGGANSADLSGYVTVGAWHHVAVTLDNAGTPNYKLYIDGVQVTSGTMSAGYWLNIAANLKIGQADVAFFSSGTNASDMKFDDLRLYDHVLAATDISILAGKTIARTNVSTAGALTIAGGVVTATKGFHKIDTEGAAATDDLDTIYGGTEGDTLIIRAADTTHTVVLKDGTGNLKLAGDCTLDNSEDTINLIFDGTNWLEVARSNNGA